MVTKFCVRLTIAALAGASLLAPGPLSNGAFAQEWRQARPSGFDRDRNGHDRHDRGDRDHRGSGHHGGSRDEHSHRHARKDRDKVVPFRDSGERRGRHHRGADHRWRDRGFHGDGPLPDHIPGLGTYSGSISAVRDRGNGIYFHFEDDGAGYYVIEAPAVPRNPKIITIGPDAGGAACEFTGAVCVIRP